MGLFSSLKDQYNKATEVVNSGYDKATSAVASAMPSTLMSEYRRSTSVNDLAEIVASRFKGQKNLRDNQEWTKYDYDVRKRAYDIMTNQPLQDDSFTNKAIGSYMSAKQGVKNVEQGLKNVGGGLYDQSQKVNAYFDKKKEEIKNTIDHAKTEEGKEDFREGLKKGAETVLGTGAEVVYEGSKDFFGGVGGLAGAGIGKIAEPAVDKLEKFGSFRKLQEIGNNLASGISQSMKSFDDNVQSLKDNDKSSFEDLGDMLKGAGKFAQSTVMTAGVGIGKAQVAGVSEIANKISSEINKKIDKAGIDYEIQQIDWQGFTDEMTRSLEDMKEQEAFKPQNAGEEVGFSIADIGEDIFIFNAFRNGVSKALLGTTKMTPTQEKAINAVTELIPFLGYETVKELANETPDLMQAGQNAIIGVGLGVVGDYLGDAIKKADPVELENIVREADDVKNTIRQNNPEWFENRMLKKHEDIQQTFGEKRLLKRSDDVMGGERMTTMQKSMGRQPNPKDIIEGRADVDPELKPLYEEARKYDSAEEWISDVSMSIDKVFPDDIEVRDLSITGSVVRGGKKPSDIDVILEVYNKKTGEKILDFLDLDTTGKKNASELLDINRKVEDILSKKLYGGKIPAQALMYTPRESSLEEPIVKLIDIYNQSKSRPVEKGIEADIQKAKSDGKSFDEFVESQPKIYRGQKDGANGLKKNKESSTSQTVGGGYYFTSDKALAQKYGEVQSVPFSEKNLLDSADVERIKYKANEELEDLVSKKIYEGDSYDRAEALAIGNYEDIAKYTQKPFIKTGRYDNTEILYFPEYDKTKAQLKAAWDTPQRVLQKDPQMSAGREMDAGDVNERAREKAETQEIPRILQEQGKQVQPKPQASPTVSKKETDEVFDEKTVSENDKILSSFKEKSSVFKDIANTKQFKSFQETWQDSTVRARRLIEEKGITVSPESSYHMEETLFHGATSSRVEKMFDEISDIDKRIKSLEKTVDNASFEDVNEFLIARHAPERNKALGEKASGITDDQAKLNIDSLKEKYGDKYPNFETIANDFQKMNNDSLDILLEGEVITKELYDTLRNKYKNHIPLYRVMEEEGDEVFTDAISGSGRFSVKGTGIKKAKGSERQVSDVQANIAHNLEQAVIRANKNKVGLSVLDMVRKNEDKLKGDIDIVSPKVIGEDFEGRLLFQDPDKNLTMTVRENGKPVYIKFKDKKIKEAFEGANIERVPSIMRVPAAITRFYSSFATRFNTDFAFSNNVRDVQDLITNTAKETSWKTAGKAVKDNLKQQSKKDVLDWMMGKDTEGAKLYEEMRNLGGTTGGLGLSTKENVKLDIDKIRNINRSNFSKSFDSFVKGIDGFNQLFEDSTRLSAYKSALDAGYSKKQSAYLAKNSTVNFNRKGTISPFANSLYMFFNASVQGTARTIKSLADPKIGIPVGVAMGGLIATQNEWNDSQDPDWRDKVSEFDKKSSLVFVTSPDNNGDFDYVTIPVSWGLRPLKTLFDEIGAIESGDSKGAGEATANVLSSMLESYNPVGGTDLVSTITPTLFDMPVDIARNKGWHGGIIRPDWLEGLSGSEQAFSSLENTLKGRTAKKLSEALEKVNINKSPHDFIYMYDTIVGGAGKTATRYADTIDSLIRTGEFPEDPKDQPVVNRFFKSVDSERIAKNIQKKETNKIMKELQNMSEEERKTRMLEEMINIGADQWSGLQYKLTEKGLSTKGVSPSFTNHESYEAFKNAPQETKDKYLENASGTAKSNAKKWEVAETLGEDVTEHSLRDALGLDNVATNAQMYSHLKKVAEIKGVDGDTIISRPPKNWRPQNGVMMKIKVDELDAQGRQKLADKLESMTESDRKKFIETVILK